MPSEIRLHPRPTSSRPPYKITTHALVYFIPGNPGYIAYYKAFLDNLHKRLHCEDAGGSTAVYIYGRDLAGFSADDETDGRLFNVGEQVDNAVFHLSRLGLDRTRRCIVHKPCDDDVSVKSRSEAFDFVILVGHSVGAYIALEAIHRNDSLAPPSKLPIRHAILLFPTISHIARSPNGKVFTAIQSRVDIEKRLVPLASAVAHRTPAPVIRFLMAWLTGIQEKAGADVTLGFVKSRRGVAQCLHMAVDEMRVIAEDKWGERFWRAGMEGDGKEKGEESGEAAGVSCVEDGAGTRPPRFLFYFGKMDRWVADEVRDEFVERSRTVEGMNVKIHVDGGEDEYGDEFVIDSMSDDGELDDEVLTHSFCLSKSQSICLSSHVQPWISALCQDFAPRVPHLAARPAPSA